MDEKLPLYIDDIIFEAAQESLKLISSCCDVRGKTCNSDIWQGNLRQFVAVLLKKLEDSK